MNFMKFMGMLSSMKTMSNELPTTRNTETWQCSLPCSEFLWDAPAEFLFEVDKETMKAPTTIAKGDVPDWTKHNGFVDNHPRCLKCGSLARPW